MARVDVPPADARPCSVCFRYFAQGFSAARRVLDGVTRDLVGLADRLGRAITRDDLDAACEQDPTANAALGATRSALRPILPTRSAVLVIRDGGRPAYRVLDGLLASAEWLYSFHVDMVQRHAAAFPTPPGALRCLLEQALGTLWWGAVPGALAASTDAVHCGCALCSGVPQLSPLAGDLLAGRGPIPALHSCTAVPSRATAAA